jgi:hypothetical protein
MFLSKKSNPVSSFTFVSYSINPIRSIIIFNYRVEFKDGKVKNFKDKLILPKVKPELWSNIPKEILEPTLQSLLIMIGINYWCVFPTNNIYIQGFRLTQNQANFWDSLYLNGLGEFFYDMKMDFHDLIKFPYDDSFTAPDPARFQYPKKMLLLNGAGKDSILSAEILKSQNIPFDFFAFAPTPAHKRISKLVGEKNINVTRQRDSALERYMAFNGISNAYPSVSTFTFIAVLLAELIGYDSIIFSNERSADFGNFKYLGLEINHQWCKSSEAENMVNEYIKKYITPDISTKSLLREYSELEIVKRFVKYPKYLNYVTSCNTYFWLPRPIQFLSYRGYWCKRCPKCVFLFACFAAFLPKKEVVNMFGDDLYNKKHLLLLIKRILGVEGFKPLDCVGEPEEMILAMHYAFIGGEYSNEPAMKIFEKYFPADYNFEELKNKVFEK